MTADDRTALLRDALADRILVLEGAMGTMIQRYSLEESDFRGDRFKDHPRDLRGNNDFLNLTRPDVIREVHDAYLEAGADFVETNTFSATSISQGDYDAQDLVAEINREGVRIAREAADAHTEKTPDKPRFVLGNLGPTNRTCSISPDVGDPGFRNITFDGMREAYREQLEALIDAGVDLIAIETVFDTLNAKAAIFAVDEVNESRGTNVPVMVSGTITDLSGRNLSGQTVGAFWNSIRHARPLAVGLNCGFGADQLRPYVEEFSTIADTFIVSYPNAGLPNEMGEYEEEPDMTAKLVRDWATSGFVNIVGGCCGTTPDHIRAIAEAVSGLKPRQVPTIDPRMRLSGLEAFVA